LEVWTKEFLEKLGDELGKVIMVDPTFKTSSFQIMENILVEIDTKDDLVESFKHNGQS